MKILSWNIGMLPVLDLFRNNEERAMAIAKALSSEDYDIIVFQEAFSAQARAIIRNSLKDHYPYIYGPVNRSNPSLKFNSGVWILSRTALVLKKEIEFTVAAGFDRFARKGAALYEGHCQNITFQLVVTHLQDDNYPQIIRDLQLSEIYEKLIIPFSDPDKPQIICGDFNTDRKIQPAYDGMLDRLNAEDGELSGNPKVSFDDESNDAYKSAKPNPRLIDYILTRNSQLIRWIRRKVTVLKSKWGQAKEYLSDHNEIEAVFEFKKFEYLSRFSQ
jgi:endonuclease/exonuclease/phosphatase family metal-dependent hydrolase